MKSTSRQEKLDTVVNYCKENNVFRRSNKPEVVSKRIYLSSYIYYIFGLTEHQVAELLDAKRDNIHRYRTNIYFLIEDPKFRSFIKDELELFPFLLPEYKVSNTSISRAITTRNIPMTIQFTRAMINKMEAYARKNYVSYLDPKDIAKHLINKALKAEEK